MKNQIHHPKTDNVRVNIKTKESMMPKKIPLFVRQFVAVTTLHQLAIAIDFFDDVFGVGIANFDVLIRGNQKSARSKCRVTHGLADLWVNHFDDGANEMARSQELSGLRLSADTPQQIFVKVAFGIGIQIKQIEFTKQVNAIPQRVAVGNL